MKFKITLCSMAVLFALSGCNTQSPSSSLQKDLNTKYTQYVDPFIGTGADGHTFPGAVLPSGMVQLSPDTELEGWGSAAGYFDHGNETDTLYGFSHTHLSGTGITDLGDILVLPFTYIDNTQENLFQKKNEVAKPGYYSVILDKDKIKAELTATTRVGYHRYTFQKGDTPNIKFDLKHTLNVSWGNRATVGEIEFIDAHTLRGKRSTDGWANNQHVYFYVKFNQPIVKAMAMLDGVKTEINIQDPRLSAIKTVAYLEFEKTNTPIELKVALSPTGVDGAEKNLNSELPGWDFDATVKKATQAWEQELSKIKIQGGTEDQKVIFYTALYHASIAPMLFQDVDGTYRSMRTQEIKNAGETPNYSVYSMWDTFRAFHPLQTIINPQRATEYANDLIRKYQDGGILPKWELHGHYTGTMVGFPAVSILADAMAKGLEVDPQQAKEAAEYTVRYHTEEEIRNAGWTEDQNIGAANVVQVKAYQDNGFVHYGYWNSASYTLEFAYGDWAMSEIARMAGDSALETEFLTRSENWRHHWDPKTGFLRPKNHPNSTNPNRPPLQFTEIMDETSPDCKMETLPGNDQPVKICPFLPFDPYYVDEFAYTEGNSWQWKFQPMHNFEGLKTAIYDADKAKGILTTPEKAFREDLDELFNASSSNTGEALPDLTGYIGQYMHGNEPSHHIPYLYNMTDTPWKTQKYLDRIMNEFYTSKPTGLIGNEDVGQMSSFYVMSAMGFYQTKPGDPRYSIGRPLFNKVTIPVQGGVFKIKADNNNSKNKYVKSVTINGQPLGENFTFRHDQIIPNGELHFVMTANKEEALRP